MNAKTNANAAGVCFFKKNEPAGDRQTITHEGEQYTLLKTLPMSDEAHAGHFQMFYAKSVYLRHQPAFGELKNGNSLLATCEIENGLSVRIKPLPYAEIAKELPQ